MTKFSKPKIHETILFLAVLSGPPRLRVRDPFASLSGEIDWSVILDVIVWSLAVVWVTRNLWQPGDRWSA
jgi:hypothetical protein